MTKHQAFSAVLLGTLLAASAVQAQETTPTTPPTPDACGLAVNSKFGTYCRLFAADSPWNLIPINPVLTDVGIPPSTWNYVPTVSKGAYSSGVFYASPTDPAVTIYGKTASGVWDPDSSSYMPNITIAHWPEGVLPATGSDGHADIVDETEGIIHSFFQLKKNETTGQWTAQQYAWTKLNGRGFGDPAHFFQGARATGVASSGGLMRKHEVKDGEPMYYHALAMSLTYNGLDRNPTYVYPATAADSDAQYTNSGQIPEGARVMLPPDFNADALQTPELQKVARTLKVYGAFIIDRNTNTPFVIYVENGADFNLHPTGWNGTAAAELIKIRASLKMMGSATTYKTGALASETKERYNGAPVGPQANFRPNLNLMSLRWVAGPTAVVTSGVDSRATYDSRMQAAVFPASTEYVRQEASLSNGITWVTYASQLVGFATYALTVQAKNNAQMRIMITGCNGIVSDTNWVGNGQMKTIPVHSSKACKIRMLMQKPASETPIDDWIKVDFKRVK